MSFYGGKNVANNAYPVLCGGTYFTLLLEARGQRTSKRSQYEGEKDGLSQTNLLAALGKIIYPEYVPPQNKQTFKTNTNAYKSCVDDGSNLSFLFPDAISAFDNRVRNEYQKALTAMCEFTDQYLEVGSSLKKEERLLKALLELLENDASIDAAQEFFVCSSGKGLTKSALSMMSDFVLQPFLLGVLHFAVVSRPDNKAGKTTFDNWCPPRYRAERKYEGTMGQGISRTINVELLATQQSEIPLLAETASEDVQPADTLPTALDTDPKRITVNNYGTVQNQKFISIETMNGDIHL
jgi:hypothetical protein